MKVPSRAGIGSLFSRPYLFSFAGVADFYGLINLIANNNGQFSAYLLVNAAGQTAPFASLVGLISLPFGFLFGLWFMGIVDGPGSILHRRRDPHRRRPLIPAVFGSTVGAYILSLVISLPARHHHGVRPVSRR